MKAILEFEDREELQYALDGPKYACQLSDIWDQLFRPAQKHGYNDPVLDSKEAYKVIEKLAEKYQDIMREE